MTPVAESLFGLSQEGAHSEDPVRTSSQHLLTNGGGGDTNTGTSATFLGGNSSIHDSSTTAVAAPSANGPTNPQQYNVQKTSAILSSKDSSQKDLRVDDSPYFAMKPPLPFQGSHFQPVRGRCQDLFSESFESPFHVEDGIRYDQESMPSSSDHPNYLPGPNELFFGEEDRSALPYKDREERVRQMRERQQHERQQKLEELKEQAAAAQRFREQQEAVRRQRLEEMRSKDCERRTQVEERKRLIQQAEQERREAVLRKSAEREQRLELKRKQERSNAVFAFGSSTPRMLDPKESAQSYFGGRRATSTTNVNMSDSSSVIRPSESQEPTDLSRKRATSAHSLIRKPEDLRMSTSMYEVFNWDDGVGPAPASVQTPPTQGDDTSTRPFAAPPPTAARRRTDLLPTFPSLRDTNTSSRGSPRHRSPGIRSGAATPGSPSRPTSSLSQSSGGNSQVMIRSRASPKKPRPLSIAGTTLSSADNPREGASEVAPSAAPASPNRESRSVDRKSSTGSLTSKPARAKSVGSDRSTPSTPAKTSRGTTPKRTPAQVKAESAARKASERSKATKLRSTPKTTPLQSPSVESKSVVGAEKPATKSKPLKEVKQKENEGEKNESPKESETVEEQPTAKVEMDAVAKVEDELVTDDVKPHQKAEEIKDEQTKEEEKENVAPELVEASTNEPIEAPEAEPSKPVEAAEAITSVPTEAAQSQPAEEAEVTTSLPVEVAEVTPNDTIKAVELKEIVDEKEQQQVQQQVQRAAEKPVTGYASEEDYKAALAEKRRQVREAKEREMELERQRQLEEEERERREEEEYLKLMEEQKNAEEERLRKAIEEAERQRVEEAIRKEEEEKQRIETEKIELQKKLEAEEKMKKEEEERQMRKSRVAAIMSRTRGKGGSAASTPNKNESKTPSDESKNLNDSIMSSSMTENLLNTISSSMSDSMIVQAIETQTQRVLPTSGQLLEEELPISSASSQPPSDISSQPLSDLSSQPLSDVSNQASSPTSADSSSQLLIDARVESQTVEVTTTPTLMESRVVVEETLLRDTDTQEELLSGKASVNLLEAQVNGSPLVPMDTTPTTHSVDLLGSFSGVNGINHNGVPPVTFQSTENNPDNQFGSLDPLSTPSQTLVTSETTFDQIIDLNQTKLTNEDAVNSNPPPPFFAFEDNLNKKSQQTQETSSNVPDLLL